MIRTPVAALFDYAARAPEEPWLFCHEGWRWHWLSFGSAAEAVSGAGGRGDGGGGGWAAGFAFVLDDLARQAAGEPVAVRGREGPRVLTAEDLAAAAHSIAALVAAPPPGRRDILVLGTDLEDPTTRALLAWGTLAGAALLLEPDPACLVGTAVWARPTVFAGGPTDLAGVRIAAERQEGTRLRRILRRPPGLPFGRLRTVLVSGPDALPPQGESFWRQRGVAVWFLPQCGITAI
jgi:hypothetical protein